MTESQCIYRHKNTNNKNAAFISGNGTVSVKSHLHHLIDISLLPGSSKIANLWYAVCHLLIIHWKFDTCRYQCLIIINLWYAIPL